MPYFNTHYELKTASLTIVDVLLKHYFIITLYMLTLLKASVGNVEGYEEKGSARDSIAKKILVSSIMFSHILISHIVV